MNINGWRRLIWLETKDAMHVWDAIHSTSVYFKIINMEIETIYVLVFAEERLSWKQAGITSMKRLG